MSTSSLLGSLLSSSQASTSSSSSIDLSSLLEAMTGASSAGIDVNSAVAAGVYAAQAPEQAWQTSLTTLGQQTTDLTSLSTSVSNLESDLTALNDPMGTMTSLSLTSSQSSILSGTATSGAVAGTHTITVNNLAQTASWYSAPVATSFTTLPGGSFNITSGGVPTTITVGSGTNSLSDLVNNINFQNLGVTASVITDSSGSRLSIVSNNSGASNGFSISNISNQSGTTSTPFLAFTQAQPGKDASLTVDGTPVTSATNTVSGVLSGVTLNLNSAATTPVSITIAPNVSAVGTAIQSFVNDYNGIMSGLNTQFTSNATTGAQGDLATDSTVRSLQQQLLAAMTYVAPNGGTESTLGAMGISMGNDGTLTLNSSTLNSALTNNFSAVQNFFQGGGLNGFAAEVGNQLSSFTSPSDGAFTLDLQSIKSESTDLQTSINNFQTNYIVPLQTQLQSEFSQAEIALQSMPQQQQQLSAELGNNTNSSNG
jgi:flagellar hook-associated protein 2